MKKNLTFVMSTLLAVAFGAVTLAGCGNSSGSVKKKWSIELSGTEAQEAFLNDIEAVSSADHIKVSYSDFSDPDYSFVEYVDGTSDYIESIGIYEGTSYSDRYWVWLEDGAYAYAVESIYGEDSSRRYIFGSYSYYKSSYREYLDGLNFIYFEDAITISYSNTGTKTTSKGVTTSEGVINIFVDYGEDEGTAEITLRTLNDLVVGFTTVETISFSDGPDTYAYEYTIEYDSSFVFERPNVEGEGWVEITDD